MHFAIDTAPLDYVALTIRVPDAAVERVATNALPADWNAMPASAACQELGRADIVCTWLVTQNKLCRHETPVYA